MKQVNRILFGLLLILFFVGAIFFYYQWDMVKKAFVAAEKENVLLKEELTKTQVKLQQKDSELTSITKEKDDLQVKMSQLEGVLAQLKQDKKVLEEEKVRLNNEMASLKESLRLWEGNISDLKEVNLVLEKRTKGAQELRKRILDLKAKIQQEIDRFKLELGNRGYITKEGKPTLSQKREIELEKIIIKRPAKKSNVN
jgi:chromosome segregation ATPase